MYNLLFLNNGYHAEHHHQPKQHWTRMKALRDETPRQGFGDGMRVLSVSHVFGFLDRSSWAIPTAKAARPSARP